MAVSSCEMVEMPIYKTSFVYIATSGGTDSAVIGSDVENVNTYYVYLSTGKFEENVTVDFAVEAGAGLTEGVDYKMVTKGNTLTFLPGIYRMPLRVQWLPNRVNDNADNTLRITLTGSNIQDIVLGMPGPDQRMKSLSLTKKNL